MNSLNFILFGLYLVGTVVLGLWVGRRNATNPRSYFLAGEGLPWYAIGGSIIAANISTEHFIGMVGIAYAVGFVVAQWEWGNVITFSALIWIFLPFYIRGGLYTMPEFTMHWARPNAPITRAVGDYYEGRMRQFAAAHPDKISAIEGKRHLSSLYFTGLESAKSFARELNRRGLDISAQTYKADCPPAVLTKLPLITTPIVVDFILEQMEAAIRSVTADVRRAASTA